MNLNLNLDLSVKRVVVITSSYSARLAYVQFEAISDVEHALEIVKSINIQIKRASNLQMENAAMNQEANQVVNIPTKSDLQYIESTQYTEHVQASTSNVLNPPKYIKVCGIPYKENESYVRSLFQGNNIFAYKISNTLSATI